MKAAVIFENGAPDVLRYEDVPDPECPDGCVLVDVEAISIEGGDLLARAGGAPPSTPHVVGYLSAGTVASAAPGVERPAVGDKVVALNAFGSHAEKRVVPAITTWPVPDGLDPAAAACVPVAFGTAEECLFTAAGLRSGQTVLVHAGAGVEDRAVGDRVVSLFGIGSHASKRVVPALVTWPIPEGLDAARAAGIPVALGTAQECLFTAGNLEAGQTALIHAGGGGVGLAAIQLAKQAGATVISTASSDEKLERLKEFGLDHGINYATENFAERTRELTDGRGADVILDSVGGQNLVDSIGALAYRGTLVSVGVAGRAGSNIEAKALWDQNQTLRGVYLGGAMLAELPRIHAMISDLIDRVASGELRVEIARSFPLEEAAAAHEFIESRQAFGRVVMTP